MPILMDDDIWNEWPAIKIALGKMGVVSENFRIYRSKWLGDFPNPHGLEMTGAEFQRMKRKPNHGKKIAGTDRTVYISKAELEKAK